MGSTARTPLSPPHPREASSANQHGATLPTPTQATALKRSALQPLRPCGERREAFRPDHLSPTNKPLPVFLVADVVMEERLYPLRGFCASM